MKGSQDEEFKLEIKQLIMEVCEVNEDVKIEDIDDDGPVFGDKSQLGLDSIDALQVSMAMQKKYGVRVTDSKEMRRVMKSINTFADFLRPE